jgi:cysteine desulfurase/selenocysteine lyase
MKVRECDMTIPVSTSEIVRAARSAAFDLRKVRADFPILQQEVRGKPLVYLDNAATTQKPRPVLDTLRHYYTRDNANVHRAVHVLSERATRGYEGARAKVQRFLNAREAREIVFVRGTTEAINLVAQSYGRANVGPGDEIVLTQMEHHSNIVPWQILCQEKQAELRVLPINDRGELLVEEYERLLTDRTRLVAVVHLSNALGTVTPVRKIIELAHRRGVPVLLDGAQAAAHLQVDVQDLDCDFYALSGHKLYGPTGIGALYGKAKLLEAMPPWQGGGDMIKSVSFAKTTYADLPNKFEAGTPHIAGAIGLGAALDYLESVGRAEIGQHETHLLRHAAARLEQIRGVRIIGTAADKAGVLSFVVEDPPIAALDVGTMLDLEGVAVRTGHHCCQPLMERLGITGTVRASLALYNTMEEVDRFADALARIVTEASGRPKSVASGPDGDAELVFPEAAAATPEQAAEELAETFDMLGDWSERYQYLLELGTKIPPLPEALKTDATRVWGCQSIAHLWPRKKPGTEDVIEFLASSDAEITRGLIALIQRLLSGQKADRIVAFNVDKLFARLDLDQHLSARRRNGMAEMLQRIRRFASEYAGKSGTS